MVWYESTLSFHLNEEQNYTELTSEILNTSDFDNIHQGEKDIYLALNGKEHYVLTMGRAARNEGIDLCFYTTERGLSRRLIGEIESICKKHGAQINFPGALINSTR